MTTTIKTRKLSSNDIDLGIAACGGRQAFVEKLLAEMGIKTLWVEALNTSDFMVTLESWQDAEAFEAVAKFVGKKAGIKMMWRS